MISTTEVEYVALSEVVTTVKLIVMVLQLMDIDDELLITIYVDNIGAIVLLNNHTTSNPTKHVDICYHLIHEYVEDGMVKFKLVKSEENNTDLVTKNLPGNLFEKHAKKFVWKCEEVDVEVQQEGCEKMMRNAGVLSST